MNRYKIIKKGVFEKESSFEDRLNSIALEGWKAISISENGGGRIIVLMEKVR